MQTNLQDINILIIDDDDVDAKSIIRTLKKAKIANPTFRAKDGIQALDILRGANGENKLPSPYILLVDLNMPRMGGIEFIKTLREDEALFASTVFVLTTSKDEQDKNAAFDLNVAGYAVKEHVGRDFLTMLSSLDHCWKVIQLPE